MLLLHIRFFVVCIFTKNFVKLPANLETEPNDQKTAGFDLVRFPDPPYSVGREKEPPRSWEFYFGAT